jgi:hypothetical protein
MAGASMRAFLGCIAAALSVMTFHQGMVALLHGVGMLATAPYQTTPVPPFGVPRIVNLCFWGGLYGIAFGLLLPRLAWPPWLCGLLMGVIAGLVGLFVVAAIKGQPLAGGWDPMAIARSLLINACWGLGVGIILPLLMPRMLMRA